MMNTGEEGVFDMTALQDQVQQLTQIFALQQKQQLQTTMTDAASAAAAASITVSLHPQMSDKPPWRNLMGM